MDELEQFRITFFEECVELLAEAETNLMELESGEGGEESLHAIFRAVHSIKGGAGAFNLNELVRFAHTFETTMDAMREGKIDTGEDALGVLLRANDILAALVEYSREGVAIDASFGSTEATELEALLTVGGVKTAATGSPTQSATETETVTVTNSDSRNLYRIGFVPAADIMRHASEPLLLLRELTALGEISISCNQANLPVLAGLEPDICYLSWTIDLISECSEGDIREVFEFVEDDCDLTVENCGNPGDGLVPDTEIEGFGLFTEQSDTLSTDDEIEGFGLFEPLPEASTSSDEGEIEGFGLFEPLPESEQAAEIAQDDAKSAGADVSAAVSPEVTPPVAKVQKTAVQQGAVKNTAQAPIGKPSAKPAAASSIRVELDKVDKLVNMVGELVITQAMLAEQVGNFPPEQFPALLSGMEELASHTRELQESVMAIRAQPVKSVFSRMPRLVRELSSKLNKKVDLEMRGEGTEVDKTVIEQLGDPLTHMIRNALDHGLEGPEERLDANKPEKGHLILSAEHRGGRILIELADDGRGINRERVLGKAQEKGLVPADSKLSDEEIDNLIFMPGFSTADAVSDVSGRGVGMDVVRSNIQGLGGRISVDSSPGRGSRFTLTLPLTLAVLDGMVCRLGDEIYIIPLANVIESLRPEDNNLKNLVDVGQVLHLRGEYVKLVHLNRLFGVANAVDVPSEAIVVLVEVEGGNKIGVIVDELLGQQQVVIKSLEANYDPVDGISAATILGNGRVALILDVDGLKELTERPKRQRRQQLSRDESGNSQIPELN